jgi:putative FmdB family regulatory protein
MPDYEYQCNDCGKTFTLHLTIAEHDKSAPPTCQYCSGTNVTQLLPRTTVITSKKS